MQKIGSLVTSLLGYSSVCMLYAMKFLYQGPVRLRKIVAAILAALEIQIQRKQKIAKQKIESKNIFLSLKYTMPGKELLIITTHSSKGMDWKGD